MSEPSLDTNLIAPSDQSVPTVPGLLEQFDVMIADAKHLSAASDYLAKQLEAKRDSLARLATDLNAHRKISADADNVVAQMIDFMVGKP